MAALVTCFNCNGTGQMSDYGAFGADFYGAKECSVCRGSGVVKSRDDRGRFTKNHGRNSPERSGAL